MERNSNERSSSENLLEYPKSEYEQPPREVRASAPGRICLCGESLDWMVGGSSVVGAIDLRTYVSVRELPVKTKSVAFLSEDLEKRGKVFSREQLETYDDENIKYLQAAIIAFEKSIGLFESISIEAKTYLPIRAGVSSSAALLLASIGALKQYHNVNLSSEDICTLAFNAEDQELKTGAGLMDFYACAQGGIRYLNCSQNPPYTEKSTQASPVKIILVDTQVPHSTKSFISDKKQRFTEREPKMMKYAKLTAKLVEDVRPLLGDFSGNIGLIGTYIYQCHAYLRDYVGCSTDLLDKCVEICMESGAYGAKLTGSGFGGCMFALTKEETAPKILQALEALSVPLKVRIINFTEEGLKLDNES